MNRKEYFNRIHKFNLRFTHYKSLLQSNMKASGDVHPKGVPIPSGLKPLACADSGLGDYSFLRLSDVRHIPLSFVIDRV